MPKPLVMIAGGGIGGLAMALTLDQIGVPFTVFETVGEMRPLGVGINIQPNAVRELFDLGIVAGRSRPHRAVGARMGAGRPQRQRHLCGAARPVGRIQMAAICRPSRRDCRCCSIGRWWSAWERRHAARQPHDRLPQRAGRHRHGFVQAADGAVSEEHGAMLIGADGLHSAVRAQMHPDQPPIQWGGAIMWRGTSLGVPIRTGASFVGLGTHRQRFVFYPISPPDPGDRARHHQLDRRSHRRHRRKAGQTAAG